MKKNISNKQRIDAALGEVLSDSPQEQSVHLREEPRIDHYITLIEDYVGGNIEDQTSIDRMGFTVFLRQTLTDLTRSWAESEHAKKVLASKSFCGCMMCLYHTEAYKQSTKPRTWDVAS